MYIAVCVSCKETSAALQQLLDLYQQKRSKHLFYRIYDNETEFLCDFLGGEYDALFFDSSPCKRIAEEIGQKDARLRLIYIAAANANITEIGGNLWYCLYQPLEALFLFPVLDRLIADTKKTSSAGITIKSKGIVTHLAFSHIEYVEVMGRSILFHLNDNRVMEVLGTLSSYETRLLQWPDFVKVHRSFIINLRHIETLRAGNIQTKGGQSVPISKNVYAAFKKDFLCRLMDPSAVKEEQDKAVIDSKSTSKYSLLLVDDEECERRRWAKVLLDKGCEVLTAADGETALDLSADRVFDCILLDVNLGSSTGFDLCNALTEKTGAPVVFLSTLSDSDNQTKGFLSGGIDYIAKDTPAELFWLKVETRMKLSKTSKAELCKGRLRLDLKERRAFLQGTELTLTTVEFDLLCILMQHPGTAYAPSRLYELVWGSGQWDDGHTVQLHLSQLCRKLEHICPSSPFIETVWGKGYRFVAE